MASPAWSSVAAIVLLFLSAAFCDTQLKLNTSIEQPIFSTESASGWSQWSDWAPCSRSCGRGLQYKLRRCFNSTCKGEGIQYATCELQRCAEDKEQVYKRQCSMHVSSFHREMFAEDLQVADVSQVPCMLSCRVWVRGKMATFHIVLPDGESCYNDMNHVCVDGNCLRLGCDGIVNSEKRYDACGRCDGDGTSCKRAVYVWEETAHYSECDTTCGIEAWQASTSICVNNKTKEWFGDEFCMDKPRPKPTLKRCVYIPCPAGWLTGKWESCDKTCGGGWQRRQVFCVEHHNVTGDKAETRLLNNGYCWNMKKPSEKQACNTHDCPEWQCSSTCGAGTQFRRVVCRQGVDKEVLNSYCDPKTMPLDHRACSHEATCEQLESSQRADYDSWMPSPWKPCTETCGLGVQNREVQCVALQILTQNLIVLPEHECDASGKPLEFKPCELSPCPNNLPMRNPPQQLSNQERSPNEYRWDLSEWGSCSASCLGGTQSILLRCVNVVSSAEIAWANCNAKQRPANLTRTCNNHPCPARWEIGNWSVCSHTCGSGMRTRRIKCVKDINRSSNSVKSLILPDDQCPLPKPMGRQGCAMNTCPPRWVVGPWSECSVTCGPGEQYRAIECEQVTAGGSVMRYDPATPCRQLPKPPTIQLCSLAGSCPVGSRVVQKLTGKSKFIKSSSSARDAASRRRLTLRVGGKATLYEGTNLKIKCPASSGGNHATKWFKNNLPIPKNDRVHVSKNGALRINSATYKDAAVYTCVADEKRRNITLLFKPRKQGRKELPWSHKSRNRTKVKPSRLAEQNYTNYWTYKELTTQLVTQSTLFVESEGPLEGNRGSQVHRGIETNELTEYDPSSTDGQQLKDGTELEDSYESNYLSPSSLFHELKENLRAKGALHVHQLLSNEESLASVRFVWTTGVWSPCSRKCQSDNLSGIQFRSVQCKVDIDGRSAYVDDKICIAVKLNKPYETQFCGTEPCPKWFAEDWSECSDSRCVRFSTAVQRRVVHCKLPNGTIADSQLLCDRMTKPKQKKECFNKNCVAEWRANDWLPCSASCGSPAMQMRVVNCVWHKTHKPAGSSCSSGLRPAVSRPCENLPPCPEEPNLEWKQLKGLQE